MQMDTEKALPLRPPQFDRTVSEAPFLDSSPNVQQSGGKPSRPSLSGIQSFQRPKKRVVWRGKACIIALPLGDGKDDAEKVPYLSSKDVRDRLEQWQSHGYDTNGFGLSPGNTDLEDSISQGQSRRVYPDPEEMLQERAKLQHRVSIPDRREWEAHVKQLNEEKLRALGVSFGDEDLSTTTTPAHQNISRNVSSHGSAMMVSPSIASSMATNGGSYMDHFVPQSRGPSNPLPSLAANASQAFAHQGKPSIAHFSRYSMVMPNGGLPPSYPMTRPTPPPSGTWSPSQQYGSQPITRGASPVVTGQLQHLGGTLSPVSTTPYSYGLPGPSPDSRQILERMQQEQARLHAQQLHQQQQQQQMLFPSATQTEPSQPGSASELYPKKVNSQPKVASPIPRGHRQNPSDTLQKRVEEARLGQDNHGDRHAREHYGQSDSGQPSNPHTKQAQRDSAPKSEVLSADDIVRKQQVEQPEDQAKARPGHASRSSIAKLDATAPAFEYHSQQPVVSDVFAFQGNRQDLPALPKQDAADAAPPTTKPSVAAEHKGFNVGAPAFIPETVQKRGAPSREFSFSSAGPTFKPDAPVFEPSSTRLSAESQQRLSRAPSGSANKIFGNIEFPEVIKPVKTSMAIPIIKPTDSELDSDDADGQEDESGRITQPEGRQKRMRWNNDDGDQVPLFAIPSSPLPMVPESQVSSRSVSPISAPISNQDNITPLETATHQLKEIIDDLPISEVSSLTESKDLSDGHYDTAVPLFANAQEAADFNAALPLQSPLEKAVQGAAAEMYHATTDAIRDFPSEFTFPGPVGNGLAGMEGHADVSKSISSTSSAESTKASSQSSSRDRRRQETADVRDFAAGSLLDGVTYIEPSFNEIDAVMKHLNDEDSDLGVERNESAWRAQNVGHSSGSNTQDLSVLHQALPAPHFRSDAPSPSPNRLREPYQYLPLTESESADTVDRELVARNARFSPSYRPSKSDVRRLNSPHSRSISDWDDAVSSGEELKFRSRSTFFDDHVHNVLGDIVRRQLGPMEKTLGAIIKDSVAALPDRPSSRKPRRTLSEEAEQSDADDEDDEGTTSQSRLKSPFRDRSYDRLKASIQELSDAQKQAAPSSQLVEIVNAVNELKTSLQQAPKSSGDIKTVVEDAVARQLRGRSGPITSSHQSASAEKSQLHIDGLESMLKIAEARAEDELKARRATEDALADNQRLLRSAMHEAAEQRESAEETERSLANFHEERHEALRRTAMLEGIHESFERTATELSEKNAALESTLEEYRLSSTQWRQEIEDAKVENSGLARTIDMLKTDTLEASKGRDTLRGRFERLQDDMMTATNSIAREQSIWRNREEEHHAKMDLLAARLEAEARTRERLEVEINRLEVQEKEAVKARFMLNQSQNANVEFERLVGQLKTESSGYQQSAFRLERDLVDARESATIEARQTKTAFESDLNGARSQANIMRAELESAIARLQSQLDESSSDAAEAVARQEQKLQEASESQKLVVQQAAEARDATAEEHKRTLEDLRAQHERASSNTLEDKVRFEEHLNQRLELADEKVAHYTDRISHLEERLELAKSAAHAAAQAAQSHKTSTPPTSRASLPFANGTNIPEKISPQALRESIMVLQEQLQAREGRIEELERDLSAVDADGPEKIKNQDMEITWLRELLGVRIDDLQDIIGTLSQPTFNREAVREAAIRLKANLQMQQQEKERAMAGDAGGQSFPSLSSISNFVASPRALPLAAAAAWGNWRKARETPIGTISGVANGSVNSTPSRSIPSAQSFLSGLMTPPSTNIRQTPPSQQDVNPSRPNPSKRPLRPYNTPRQSFTLQEDESPQQSSNPPITPPLMRQTSYDQDAQSADFTEDDVMKYRHQSTSEDEPFGPRIENVANLP